jgi:ribosomal protein L13E
MPLWCFTGRVLKEKKEGGGFTKMVVGKKRLESKNLTKRGMDVNLRKERENQNVKFNPHKITNVLDDGCGNSQKTERRRGG